MQVLVVGGGGREHALAWKLAQSAMAERIFVAPGNAGTASEAKVENLAIGADDIEALLAFARRQSIDLTVVGPEAPLVNGIVDRFAAANLQCLGPMRAAARLEGSKAFTKRFLTRHDIPTAHYATFGDLHAARHYLRRQPTPLVVKADGLAAGKGVVIAQTHEQADDAISRMLSGDAFGAAGRQVVIEEFLAGEEASFICLADDQMVLPFASSQDHKARDDGDSGPNTGGMGAYSPAPVIDESLYQRVMQQVIEPTLRGMADDGMPYRGFLYAGLMIDQHGNPKVLEFNCRFGDPETQPILVRLQSDLLRCCLAAVQGDLNQQQLTWDERAAVGIVAASGGYPGSYHTGKPIEGLDRVDTSTTKVFHAGTVYRDGAVVTNGGRVLCVCSLGGTVSDAQRNAYAALKDIHFENMYFRTDIGYRAVARERRA